MTVQKDAMGQFVAFVYFYKMSYDKLLFGNLDFDKSRSTLATVFSSQSSLLSYQQASN
jgi:hypothetical protein